jgi:hypothetical protein
MLGKFTLCCCNCMEARNTNIHVQKEVKEIAPNIAMKLTTFQFNIRSHEPYSTCNIKKWHEIHCHDNSSDCVLYLDRYAIRFWTALTVTVIITVAVSSTVWRGRDQIRSDLLLQSKLRALGQAEAQGVYLNHQGRKGSFCEVEPSWVPLP